MRKVAGDATMEVPSTISERAENPEVLERNENAEI